MDINRQSLDKAVDAKILSKPQAYALWNFLSEAKKNTPVFDLVNVIYYFGGMLAIGAMSIFMTYAWEQLGGNGIFFLCLCYSLLGLALCLKFVSKKQRIPAGICATFIIAITPLAIYGLQLGLDIWPKNIHYYDYHRLIEWHWLYMELGTLIVGVILAWWLRYPFMTMPIAFTIWYLSMDLSVWLAHKQQFSWEIRSLVSIYLGLSTTLLAFWVEKRTTSGEDYSYWLYLFGVITFWCGLSGQMSDTELARFFYFLINLAMIGIGVYLVRKVFVVFGAIGSFMYIGHLAFEIFGNNIWFATVLSGIGFGIIYLGTLWKK
jgi:hypothetical protein